MSKELEVLNNIKSKIHTIRGKQVMFDSDLAKVYGVETRALNQAVKRNSERFPERFAFKLSKSEENFLKSQIVTLESGRGKHRKYLPYVFTEQGVAMLSSVLKSKKAVKINIYIMDAFVELRKTLRNNIYTLQKFQQIDQKLLTHDAQFNEIFNKLEKKSLPNKGIFFDGQIFDSYKLVSDLLKSANKKIILIDNYVD